MKIDWGNVIFILGYHVGLLIGLPVYFYLYSPPLSLLIISFILLYATGLSVTCGYHRLYSHSTYKTNRFVECILLFFGSMATQGSALQWAYDHRLHHSFVDTEKDPYSIKKGFLYAHIFWMFRKRPLPEKRYVSDLMRNPLIMFQHRHYNLCMFSTNIVAFVFFGWLCRDYLSSFVFVWWVRLFFLHHFTWFINSLAHTWGSKSFSKEHSAVDNYIISLLTFGEGYHNYHHSFAGDYRNGTRWYHFDPSKWIIWTLSQFGAARNLKKMHAIRIQERIVLERKKELLFRLKNYWFVQKCQLEEKVDQVTQDLLTKLKAFRELLQEYRANKKMKAPKEKLEKLQKSLQELKRSLREDFRNWKKISKMVMKTPKHALS